MKWDIMEIEIQSKTNNPLLGRTEIYFKITHEGEGTPKRELVRSELAEKLNVNKENIMINYMRSEFGAMETLGYARIYKSLEEALSREKEHILKRNKAIKEKEPKEKIEMKEEKKE
jgi:small subunit ribosomal protein S24e